MMPAIQVVAVIGVVALLLVAVIPQISVAFVSLGTELPPMTRFMIGLSSILTDYYLFLIMGIVALAVLFYWWKNTDAGARTWDTFILKLPIVGYFARMGAVVQFTRTLGMLMEAGVNLSDALTIVTTIVKNKILVDKLQQAREGIIKQGKIAQYLKETGMFPAAAIYLITTGEESGTLDKMLLQVASFYDAEVSDYADGLVEVLNPIMTGVIGIVVGVVIMSIVQPMMQMNEKISNLTEQTQ